MSVQQILLGLGGAAAASSIISSIQQVEITIAGTATSNTATISTVDTARTTIFWQGQTTNTGNPDKIFAYATLTDATTVTLTRNAGATSEDCTYRFVVVEWETGIVDSVQYGTIAMTAVSTNTGAISSVTTTDSALTFLGSLNNYTGTAHERAWCAGSITSATQVTAVRGAATSNATLGFCVTEFASGILDQNTEQFNILVAAASTSNTATITSSTEANTMCFYGGLSNTSANANSGKFSYLQQTSDTQFTATRSDTTNSSTNYGTAVKFKSADIVGRNEGTSVVATTQTIQNNTISSVDTAKTIAVCIGLSSSGNSVVAESLSEVWLQSATNVRSERNTTDAALTATAAYQTMEFN